MVASMRVSLLQEFERNNSVSIPEAQCAPYQGCPLPNGVASPSQPGLCSVDPHAVGYELFFPRDRQLGLRQRFYHGVSSSEMKCQHDLICIVQKAKRNKFGDGSLEPAIGF